MTEQRNDSEIVVKTQFIIDHLEKESEYLDTVFACSKEIQSSPVSYTHLTLPTIYSV